jgi:chromosome segregation ATPase
MKQIKLKQLQLKNFKGIRDKVIEFKDVTNIYGENASGKTTVNDAFRWLLFDKDSTDRKDFEIKTLDASGEALHGLEHTVTAVISIDGKEITLSKTYKEKWAKKRGESDKQMTGHETLCSVDDVPVKANEYKAEISSIITEEIFKLLTDPFYFSQTMKWADRRTILEKLGKEITNDDVYNVNPDLEELAASMNGMDIDKLKSSLAAKRKKLNDEIKSIPYRIDECNNSIIDVDGKQLKSELQKSEKELTAIDDQLTDHSKVNPVIEHKRNEISAKHNELRKIEQAAEKEIIDAANEMDIELNSLLNKKNGLENSLKYARQDEHYLIESVHKKEQEMKKYRDEWEKVNATQFEFDDKLAKCPTCLRDFPADEVEGKRNELLENFNLNKATELENITDMGVKLKKQKEEFQKDVDKKQAEIESTTQEIIALGMDIEKLEKKLSDKKKEPVKLPVEYDTLKNEIDALEEELEAPSDSKADLEKLISEKRELVSKIDSLKSELRQGETNVKMEARIKELKADEKKLAQQIADIEKQEFMCEEFIKTKAEMIEDTINSHFNYVKFKLFDTQINGGIVPTCEPLINGVPFSDANNAAKYNAGIDIINTISEHYQVNAPIVIDNREGINHIIPTKSQVINLIVSTDKNLRID